jgi:hypothetical protein
LLALEWILRTGGLVFGGHRGRGWAELRERETETDSDRETERTLGLLGLEKLCEYFVKELRTLRNFFLGKRGMLIF